MSTKDTGKQNKPKSKQSSERTAGTAKPRIVVLNAPDDERLPGLDALAGDADVEQVAQENALTSSLPQADILVVTDFRSDLMQRVWHHQNHIRWVHATSAGIDALRFEPLWSSDVTITNARGVFDRGIAEYVLGSVLFFAKDTLGNLRHQRAHRWAHRETPLIRDQRALIVGAGSIGHEVATLLGAAGMRVTGVARSAREDPIFETIHAQEELPELLPEANYVVITAPLTEQTRGLFDAEMLARIPDSAYLINVGRGAIVRTEALVEALKGKALAGAALDVFEQEPLPADHPLWDMPQVMISAHMAGDFQGWREALGEQFVENFRRWQRGETLHNRVQR